MNQLETIEYVFAELLRKYKELALFYSVFSEELKKIVVDENEEPEIDFDVLEDLIKKTDTDKKYLYELVDIINKQLDNTPATKLIDFKKTCDDLSKKSLESSLQPNET